MTDEEATTPESEEEESEEKLIPWKQFLEEFPLNTFQKVSGYYYQTRHSPAYTSLDRSAPTLRLRCPDEDCQGIRNFSGKWIHYPSIEDEQIRLDFMEYTCNDCGKAQKRYALISKRIDDDGNG